MKAITFIAAAMVVFMFAPAFSAAGDVVIIGNQSIKKSTLSKQDIQYIFLGKKTTWEDGRKIKFALQETNTIHEKFLKKYVQKSRSQFSTYWKRRVFSGKGSLPKSFENDQKMIDFIRETSGAIGYVYSENNLEKVKVLKIQ